jgi:hypothetical protein
MTSSLPRDDRCTKGFLKGDNNAVNAGIGSNAFSTQVKSVA